MLIGFIVNPAAGRGRAARLWTKIEGQLLEKGCSFRCYPSPGPGALQQLASQAAAECDAVAAVGGDGTLHQVLNGVIGTGVPLGIVPAGSGNDFCRSLGIHRDAVKAALGLYQAEEQRFDCGWLDQEAFINVAGVGFDAAVCAAQERRWRFLPGSISYVAAVLDALVHLRPSSITLKLDDTVLERQALLVAIANGQTFGGGMVIAPEARPDDGLLDVILVGPLSRSAFMRFFPLVYRGQHVNHPAVEVWRARRIEITASPAMPCQAEGEAMGYTPTLVQVEPGVIPFLIPRPSPGPP